MRRRNSNIFGLLLMTIYFLTACGTSTSEKREEQIALAATMRLEQMTGEVSVFEMGEKLVYIMEKMRLHTGYALETAKESVAHISLDDTKAVKMDERSHVFIEEGGKNLVLKVTEGKLFFNVDQPLEKDESFQIHTSNAILGIRGTSGFVVSENVNESELYLLTGKAEIKVVSPVDGKEKKESILPGEKVTVYKNELADNKEKVRIVKERYTEKEIPSFVAAYLENDPSLWKEIAYKTNLKWENVSYDDDVDDDDDYDDNDDEDDDGDDDNDDDHDGDDKDNDGDDDNDDDHDGDDKDNDEGDDEDDEGDNDDDD